MNVSVIIPVYKAEAFVEKAVRSALSHPEVKEILLVEDGSADGSLDVCKQLAQNHVEVQVLQHPHGINKGAGASRNLGIKNATQEYIAFLDADDYYTAIRFQKEKEVFKNHPEADGVYGAIGVEYLDAVGATAWEQKGLDEHSLTTVNKPIDPAHLFEFLISVKNPNRYQGYYSIDGLTLRRESLAKSGLLFNTSLRLHQDTVFLWQTSYALKLFTGEYQKPIAMRGVHESNRFIHAKKINLSRSKQFKVLRDWAIDKKLNTNILERFQKKYFQHVIASKPKVLLPFYYLKLLVLDAPTQRTFSKKQIKTVLQQIQGK